MRLATVCTVCRVGRLRARRTITRGSSRTRYLRCDHCLSTGKEVLRIDVSTGRPIEASFFSGVVSSDRK
jgi:hypothetical protein